MAARQRRSREDILIDEDPFRSNALFLIKNMVELTIPAPDAAPDEAPDEAKRALVDEILHSIFFLGRMRTPTFSPERILSNGERLKDLMRDFPRPFELYSSQLPRRSPFSCVLDMIVLLSGRQNETVIIDRLRMLIKKLNPDKSRDLVPATICVSNKIDLNKDQFKYYGVSITAPGRYPRKIMIAASCFSSWDRYVAGAVMTYFPKDEKKPNFDGTIKLPKDVRCQAFDLLDGNEKLPCRSCGNLFDLTTTEIKVWIYGNCAENESLSNLFKNEDAVKDEARPTSGKYSDEMREMVKDHLMTSLRKWLGFRFFRWNDDKFYSPQ